MNILRAIFRAIFSRQMLIILAVVILSIALWFLGPLLSFGGLHPLGSIAMRITAIVFLVALLLFFLLHWPVSVLGVAAMCILFWHAGPLLAFGDSYPFATVDVRLWIIGSVLLCYAFYGLYRLWQGLRNDEELLNRFLLRGRDKKEEEEGENQQAKENLKAVAGIINHAMHQLKRLHTRSSLLRRAFESKRYLYELPWYMIIGNPGAGKTTAIINSGLKFPLAEQMGRVFQTVNKTSGAIAGEGGTKHCDWWFTNNAIFIDTAGRYTSQDSAPQTDSAEWYGFLGMLRKNRSRAPINGAILSINVADLIAQDKSSRMAHASYLRDRLLQLRQELGIRFPVYVMVTKMDMLEGFEPYFGYLTSESRAQVWGFTLPLPQKKSRSPFSRHNEGAESESVDLAVQLKQNLGELVERLEQGLPQRLQEEFDLERRRALYALPQEFDSMTQTLTPFLEEIFLDSLFDGTQLHNTLRGVYFTSGIQTDQTLAANPNTLLQRLMNLLRGKRRVEDGSAQPEGSVGVENHPARETALTGNRGFFLVDLFNRVIIPEAGLVRPNLKWEARFLMMRLLGHTLVILICIWLASALYISHDNNKNYLQTVSSHADTLHEKVSLLFSKQPSEQLHLVPGVLDNAQTLPEFEPLDLADPSYAFRYGLYTPPPIVKKASETYDGLQDKLLLPLVMQRMETVLREAIRTTNDRLTYDTLRVYLELHEAARYKPADIREWLRQDWENPENALLFTSQAPVVYHLGQLFADGRLVQAPSRINEPLVQQARNFLETRPSPQRLYERAKQAMSQAAPPEFTLIQAVGPQAGSVFVRASGEPLDRGIPGLFTYDGYHQVFDAQLNEFVLNARMDDAWVMGREKESGSLEAQKKKLEELRDRVTDDPVMQDIRRQYLVEYAERWQAFLEDIRPVTGSALSVNLIVVRKFASPDSPLLRLARAAARETTLSRQLVQYDPEKGALEKTVETIDKKTQEIKRDLGMRAQAKMERAEVDDHFAALREIVTGQPDPVHNQMMVLGRQSGSGGTHMAGTSIVSLSSIMGMLNEYHNQLVAADLALTTNNVPQNLGAASLKLRMDAAKLPPPFFGILTALTESSDEKINESTTSLLNVQAQDQIERTLASMTYQVENPCRQGISGHYPFADSNYDASIEDFTRIFAANGSADTFFQKYLSPFVDTGERPWRYKTSFGGAVNPLMAGGGDGPGLGAAPTTSTNPNAPSLQSEYVKLLRQYIPNPDAFAQIKSIRELFFRDSAGKMSWKMDLKVVDIDPTIVELMINIDGQTQRYVHGPIQTMSITWPGPRGGAIAELTALPKVRTDTSAIITNGPWALFRLLDRGRIINTASPGHALVEYDFDGRKVLFEINTGAQQNPLTTNLLKNFRCPGDV